MSAHGKETDKDDTSKFSTKQLTVQELKAKLEEKNLASDGQKEDLVKHCNKHGLSVTKKVFAKKEMLVQVCIISCAIVMTSNKKSHKCSMS